MRAGAILVAALLAWPLAAQAAWRRAETASFVGYSRGSEKELRARLHELQDFDALLRLVTGTTAPPSVARLPVFFVSGRDLKTLGVSDPTVAGFYVASPGLIYAAVATDRTTTMTNGLNTLLFHEYTHHFMFQYYTAAYPAWYVEGYAEYMSTANFKPGLTSFGDYDRGRIYQLTSLPWIPMQTLLTARASDLKSNQVSAFYAQSWLATHYMLRDPARRKLLVAYLRLVADGTPREEAFAKSFGMTFSQFTAALHAYLTSKSFTRSQMSGSGAGPSAADPVTGVTLLPASADDLLIPATRLALVEGRADMPALLATIQAAAAKYPGEAYAESVLAEAEIKLGDRAAGIARLDARLAVTPDDPQLLYLRGRAYLHDANAERLAGQNPEEMFHKAKIALTAANRARPDDYRILYAHALAARGNRLPDNELPVLLRAAELAPQVGEVAVFAARALAVRGETARARQLLLPVANDPHAGPGAKAAAAMLATLGEKPDAASGVAQPAPQAGTEPN